MEDLLVWNKAHELALDVYKVTKDYPKAEQYGLASQMRRAAVSIPSNIVEGRGRGTSNEFKRFLLIARGSLEELKYQILLSNDLNYIDKKMYVTLQDKAKEVGRLLNGFIVAVSRN